MRLSIQRALVILAAALPGVLLAEASDDVVRNWSAPPYFQSDAGKTAASNGRVDAKSTEAVDGAPKPFVALSPCRLADTRPENGFPPPYGPPALTNGITRDFPVAGHCGVPVGATAVSFNFTVVRTQALGYLATYPQGESWPGTSTLNYVAGQIVANNAAIALGPTGALTVFVSGGQSDLIIDINGYYGGTFVSSVNGLDGDVDIVPGNNVTITPSGNTLVIDAPLVQGPPGPQGAQGPQGATGPQGAVGPQGAPGAQGAIGPQGNPGAPGLPGAPGTPGAPGAQGDPGAPGASMSFLGAWDSGTTYAALQSVSFNGSSYVSLVDGNTNNTPDASPLAWALIAQKGATGNSGADGAQGVAGPQGPAGPTGATGAIGPQGAAGATGAVGPQGPIGATGAIGPQGVPGLIGPQGVPGTPGAPGAQGDPGAQGASMSFLGAWDSGTTYATLQSVSFNGSSYVSLVDGNSNNTPDASPLAWALIAEKGATGDTGSTGAQGPQGETGATGAAGPQGVVGPQGLQGPIGPQGIPGQDGAQGVPGAQGVQGASLSFAGAWDSGTTYSTLQVVSFGGSSYISLVDDNLDNSPDSSPLAWSEIAERGATGDTGADGAQGPVGPVGPQGPVGNTGATGAVGPQGPVGNTGATGAVGPQGPIGNTGATGAVGPQGPVGNTGATGAVGPQGPVGNTGATGATGPQGNPGLPGAPGATGAQGPIGPVGPQGPPGPAGSGGTMFSMKHDFNLSGAGGTRYFNPIHIDDQNTEDFDVVGIVAKACSMSTLVARVDSLTAGVTATLTLRKGATIATMANTALTCNLTSVALSCTSTGAVALTTSDLFDIRLTYTAGDAGSDRVFLTSLACD